MARAIVLIHSPLVGAMMWHRTAMHFRDRGHRTVVPSLSGIAEQGPPYYERFAEAVASKIHATKSEAVALVAHSGAGGLVPSVVAASDVPINSILFVDALLPHPGMSWMDTAPERLRERLAGLATNGLLPPWNEWFPPSVLEDLLPEASIRKRFVSDLPRLPLNYFETPAPAAEDWRASPSGYLQLSSAYEQETKEAERRGWLTRREPSSHLAMLTRPEPVADMILLVLGTLEGTPRSPEKRPPNSQTS